MAIKTFTSGEVLTASDTNAYLNNGGLVYITQATMSTGTTSINNCFTSAYRNYRVLITTSVVGANASFNLRFRAGGTDNSSASYKFALWNISTVATTGSLVGNGNTEIAFAFVGSANGDTSTAMDIHDPQLAHRTKGSSTFFGYDSANWWNRGGGFMFDATNQFDGFTVFTSAGTITGLIQVFGYRNA